MPIEFKNTLVAFLDISGFKVMMKQSQNIYNTMRKFYNAGYQSLAIYKQKKPYVEGYFISDCGILVVNEVSKGKEKSQIDNLLKIVKVLNMKMFELKIMLTTSIAYGDFTYISLKEHKLIEKMALYGEGYLKAYLNAEVEEPKMEPGQCRITIEELPPNYKKYFKKHPLCINTSDINKIDSEYDDKYFYYYWMVENKLHIRDFEEEYNKSYNLGKEEKYEVMKKALLKATKDYRSSHIIKI